MKRGQGARCYGYEMARGNAVVCTQIASAHASGNGWVHVMDRPCDCGEDHSAGYRGDFIPRRTPDAPVKITQAHKSRTPDAIHDYGAARLLRYGSGKDKRLCWQHFDRDHGWIDGLGGVTPGFYRAEAVRNADARKPVYLAGGEKCVDALVAAGAVAGCNPGGENKQWRDEWSELFRGRTVIILADADKAGRDHAQVIADALVSIAASVRIIELEGAHDVADWLADGHELTELLEIAVATPVKSIIDFTPPPSDEIERLRAENIRLTEKLFWIFATLAIPEERMALGVRVTLILAVQRSMWSENLREGRRDIEGVTVQPDTWGDIAAACGMSNGTAAKNIRALEKNYELVTVKNFTEVNDNGDTIPRIAYSVEPAKIHNHQEWMPKDGPRKKRGGKRAGAGRPAKVCQKPGCGGEEFTPERTYRTVREVVTRESYCKKCGTLHREVVSDEEVGSEEITDGVKSIIDFTTEATPAEGSESAEREINPEPPPLDPDTPIIDFTPECHATGNTHVYAMMRDAKGRRVCIACEKPEGPVS